MELEVQKEKKLDDGLHKGIIIEVNYRTEPYNYTDVIIELADKFKVTAGYPTQVTKSSKLGKLLARFGADVVEGKKITPENILVGKACVFQTTTTEKGDRKFSKVLAESLIPE